MPGMESLCRTPARSRRKQRSSTSLCLCSAWSRTPNSSSPSPLRCVHVFTCQRVYLITCNSVCIACELFLCVQAGLPGFYDPCVGEEKSLKLLYQFRGVMHQVISADAESLRIPKQCKCAVASPKTLYYYNIAAH